MFRERQRPLEFHVLPAALGAAAGMAAGWLVGRRRRREALALRDAIRLEQAVVDALLQDAALRERPIDVAALGAGIIELSGRVDTPAESGRSVEVARTVESVRTVLNRLDVRYVETRLEGNRRRHESGAPELNETHWYGLGVGTGRRRQGHETDPARPDDKVPIVTGELGVDRAIEQTSETLDKLATGVEGHSSVPAAPTDRGRADDASHRRLGNVPPDPIQDLNPAAGIHENIKKGTELTLEASGLEAELEERGQEDRG